MADYNLGTARGTIELNYRDNGSPGRARSSLLGIGGAAGVAAAGVTAGVGALAAGLIISTNAAANFDAKLSGIQAVSGATAQQMEAVRQKALQLGKDTVFSAGGAADAITELAKAGVSLPDILGGAADATVSLAAAGGIDLPQAATIASNAMNQFQLKAQDMPRIADLIAGAANASAIDVADMGNSFAYVAPVAHALGLSIQDTSTALAILGNQGIKGTSAGTALRSILAQLSPSTKKATTAFKDLGLITANGANVFYDATGKIKPLNQVIDILHEKTKGLNAQQKVAFTKKAFGTEDLAAVSILMGQTGKSVDGMAKSIGKVKAADVAATKMNNLKGSMEQLKGSLETLEIQVGEALQKPLKALADFANVIVGKLIGATDKIPGAIAAVQKAFSGLFSSVSGGNISGVASDLSVAFSGMASEISAAFDTVAPIVLAFGDNMTKIFSTLGPPIANLVDTLLPMLVSVFGALATVFLTKVLPPLLAFEQFVFSRIIPVIVQMVNIFTTQVLPILSQFALFIIQQVVPAVVQIVSNIAQKLKPVFDQLVATFQKSVLPALQSLLAKFHEYQPQIQAVTLFILKLVGGILTLAAAILGKVLPPVIRFSGFMIGTFIKSIALGIDIIAAIVRVIIGIGSAFGTAYTAVSNAVKKTIDKIGEINKNIHDLPGKITSALGDVGGLLRDAGIAIMESLLHGLTAGFDKVKDFVGGVAGKIADLKGPLPYDRVLLIPHGLAIMAGLNDGLARGTVQVYQQVAGVAAKMVDTLSAGIRTNKLSTTGLESQIITLIANIRNAAAKGVKGANSLVSVLTRENNQLNGLVAKRASIATRLASASASLAAAQKVAGDVKANVSSTISGLFDITQSNGDVNGTISNLQDIVKQAGDFKTSIAALVKKGFSTQEVAQLAAAGPTAAAAQINAFLAATPAQVKQVNSLVASLAATAGATGSSVADSLYGAGIRAAQGLVNGLKSQQLAIQRQMNVIANTMISTIKRALGIHSPSRVFHGFGSNTLEGYVNGVKSQFPSVAKTMSNAAKIITGGNFAVGQTASTRFTAPASGGDAAMRPVKTYNLTVHQAKDKPTARLITDTLRQVDTLYGDVGVY